MKSRRGFTNKYKIPWTFYRPRGIFGNNVQILKRKSETSLKLVQCVVAGVPTEYKREFINKICRENFLHMVIISILFIIAELSLAVFTEPFDSSTFYLAMGIALFNLILFPVLQYSKIKIEKLSVFQIMGTQLLFSAGILSGGLLWSLYEQSLFVSGSTYMLALYVVSAFTVMPPPISAVLFLVFALLFVYLLPSYQFITEAILILNINIISMSVIAWILNMTTYNRRINTFLNEKEIVEKNRELETVNTELRDMTMRDSMTGLLNHKCSMKRLKEEIDRARRIQYPLSVAMIDLDNFKDINDSFGHQIGDEIIIQVSYTIKEACRTTDIVGRYGGEEFIVIMPDTSSEDAELMLKRIQEKIGGNDYKEGIHITFSCGISELNGDSVHGLLKTSDFKLYEAKRKGKNRIEVQLNKNEKSAVVN